MRPGRLGDVLRGARAIGRSRRPTTVTGLLVVGALALAATTVPAAAVNEQGAISVTGTDPPGPYPCLSCSSVFSVVTAGYVAGIDGGGIPFTLSWSVPNASLTLTVSDYCSQPTVPDPFPAVQSMSGDLKVISQATLNYDGVVHQNASVDAQFTASQELNGQPGFTVNYLYLTIQWGSIQETFQVGLPNGVYTMTPTNAALCPTNTTTSIALAGTLLSTL